MTKKNTTLDKIICKIDKAKGNKKFYKELLKLYKNIETLEGKLAKSKDKNKALKETNVKLKGDYKHQNNRLETIVNEVEDLQLTIVNLQDSLDAAIEAQSNNQVEISDLQAKLEDAQAENTAAQQSNADLHEQVNSLEMRLAELQVHHDTVISTNNDYVDKIATLEFSFGDLQGHYENAQSANTELTSSNVELAEQVGALESANGEIQQENANLTSKIADLANKLSILHSEKESIADEHSSCGEQIANLEAKLQAAKVATTKVEEKKEPETVLERIAAKADEIDFSRIGTATEGNKDDLKRIKGIGPYIEQKLNVLGIFTFEQMSNLTEEDVDKINKIIEFFPGRAKRDKWVEQAQNIAPKSSFFS